MQISESLRNAILSFLIYLRLLAAKTETKVDDGVVAVLETLLKSDLLTSWLRDQALVDLPTGAVRVMELNDEEAAEAERLEINVEQIESIASLLPLLREIFKMFSR